MKRIRHILRNDLVHNTLALYGVQVCRKLLPIVSVPYLARVLRPDGWGTVAFVSSLGEFVVLLIEFGFNLSATREISQNRDSPERCGRIASGVIASQLLLATVAMTAVLIAGRYIPVLRDHPALLWAGLFYGVFQGMNPIWFFQGLENIRLAAAIEIAGKVIGLIGIFVLVKSPADDWKVLGLQAVPAILATVAGFGLAVRTIRLRIPTPGQIGHSLKSSWPMFVFRSGESLYGVGNAFVLGLFASPASVGYFAIAEKISKAIFGLMNPIREALYPRLSKLAAHSKDEAARLARIGAVVMVFGGLMLGAGIYVGAPLLIRMAGSGVFEPAVNVLRIFAILPPLLSVTYSVGLQWLLPFGKDAIVNRIILSAGALNLILAFVLAPRFTHYGMAWAVVCAETFVCVSMVVAVIQTTPFWGKAVKTQPQAVNTGLDAA